MSRSWFLALAFIVCAAGRSDGSVISFDPPVEIIDPASGDTVVGFNVGVASTPFDQGRLQGVDLVIGSDDLQILGLQWAYYPPWPGRTCTPANCAPPAGVYPSDAHVSGFYVNGIAPILFGRLWVDAEGLGPGTYTVLVDAQRDGISNVRFIGQTDRNVAGSARVRVVPEPPAAMLLTSAAACFLIRRRFR